MLPLPLLDTFERQHTNLRINVTDRCNIWCLYCMPADNVQFMDRRELPGHHTNVADFVQPQRPMYSVEG